MKIADGFVEREKPVCQPRANFARQTARRGDSELAGVRPRARHDIQNRAGSRFSQTNPDKLAVATDGARRFSGMIAAWLNKLAGTQISYVPYTQMTQGVQDVLTRRVQLLIIATPTARGHVTSGKLRALAVTSAKRLPDFPDVPAVAETFPGFDFAGWFVLAAPTGVPDPIAARVNREMAAIMTDPAIVKKLGDVGYVSHGGGTLKEVRDYVQAQYAAWGTLVKEIGLQPE